MHSWKVWQRAKEKVLTRYFSEYAPMGKQQYNIINFLYIGYILIYAPIQGAVDRNLMITAFLIHAPARDATLRWIYTFPVHQF